MNQGLHCIELLRKEAEDHFKNNVANIDVNVEQDEGTGRGERN